MRCPHCGQPIEQPSPDPELPWLLSSADRKLLRSMRINGDREPDGQNSTEKERE